jgi:hypothetical protein
MPLLPLPEFVTYWSYATRNATNPVGDGFVLGSVLGLTLLTAPGAPGAGDDEPADQRADNGREQKHHNHRRPYLTEHPAHADGLAVVDREPEEHEPENAGEDQTKQGADIAG